MYDIALETPANRLSAEVAQVTADQRTKTSAGDSMCPSYEYVVRGESNGEGTYPRTTSIIPNL